MKLSSREREADKRFREKLRDVDWFGMPLYFGVRNFTLCLDGHFSIEDLELIVEAMREYFEYIEKEENAAN